MKTLKQSFDHGFNTGVAYTQRKLANSPGMWEQLQGLKSRAGNAYEAFRQDPNAPPPPQAQPQAQGGISAPMMAAGGLAAGGAGAYGLGRGIEGAVKAIDESYDKQKLFRGHIDDLEDIRRSIGVSSRDLAEAGADPKLLHTPRNPLTPQYNPYSIKQELLDINSNAKKMEELYDNKGFKSVIGDKLRKSRLGAYLDKDILPTAKTIKNIGKGTAALGGLTAGAYGLHKLFGGGQNKQANDDSLLSFSDIPAIAASTIGIGGLGYGVGKGLEAASNAANEADRVKELVGQSVKNIIAQNEGISRKTTLALMPLSGERHYNKTLPRNEEKLIKAMDDALGLKMMNSPFEIGTNRLHINHNALKLQNKLFEEKGVRAAIGEALQNSNIGKRILGLAENKENLKALKDSGKITMGLGGLAAGAYGLSRLFGGSGQQQ